MYFGIEAVEVPATEVSGTLCGTENADTPEFSPPILCPGTIPGTVFALLAAEAAPCA